MIAVALTCTASTAEGAVPRIVMIAMILPNIVPVPHSPALDFPGARPASLPRGPLAEYGQSHKSAATNRRFFSDSVGWCWTSRSGPIPIVNPTNPIELALSTMLLSVDDAPTPGLQSPRPRTVNADSLFGLHYQITITYKLGHQAP